jgi:hypothetical protein
MPTKLGVYNSSLLWLEERALTALTESVESRRVLDSIWTETTNYCLARGQWKFAKRSVELEESASINPTFGYAYAFEKPTDYLRLTAFSSSDRLLPPLLDYSEEGDYWYADITPIYAAYISNDTSWGMDLGKWFPAFAEYVSVRLARKACGRLSSKSNLREELRKEERKALLEAMSHDAMAGPPQFRNMGSWSGARLVGDSIARGRRYLRG